MSADPREWLGEGVSPRGSWEEDQRKRRRQVEDLTEDLKDCDRKAKKFKEDLEDEREGISALYRKTKQMLERIDEKEAHVRRLEDRVDELLEAMAASIQGLEEAQRADMSAAIAAKARLLSSSEARLQRGRFLSCLRVRVSVHILVCHDTCCWACTHVRMRAIGCPVHRGRQ